MMSINTKTTEADKFEALKEVLAKKGITTDALMKSSFFADTSKLLPTNPETTAENNPSDDHVRQVFGRSMY
jgi:hypothetical protein